MTDLWTASACLSQLKADDKPISKGYFSQRVADGTIPCHKKPGSPKNFHKYHEVVAALKKAEDPTRDAQRDANKEKKLVTPANDLFDKVNLPKNSIADLSAEDQMKALQVEGIDLIESEEGANLSEVAKKLDISLADAKILKEYYLGRKAQLEVQQKEGELVEQSEVKKQAFELARSVRDAIMRLPDRIGPILTPMTDEHEVKMRLTKELMSALEALGE